MQTILKYRRISLVIKILLIGFGISLMINFILGNYLKLGYPFNTFLFRTEVIFRDFIYPNNIAADPYSTLLEKTVAGGISWKLPEIIKGDLWIKNGLGPLYFPFAYWIAYPFHLLPFGSAILAFWIISVLIFVLICFKQIRRPAGVGRALLVCVLSYPFLFLVDRSNFEIFIFLFVYLFFLWYDRHPWLSAGALAFATAMKFLPIGYVILYLRDRKYKQAIFTGGLAFVLNVAGYALYPGGLISNIRAHLFNLRLSSLYYGFIGSDVAFNSSLSSGVKYLFLLFWPKPDLEAAGLAAAGVISWLIPLVAGIVLIYFFLLEKERWKQATLVTCLILLLPASSADYRLLLIYVPFFLWLDTPAQSYYDYIYAFLFAGLFIPKSYFHLPVLPEISISVLVNPLLMLGLIGLIVVEKMKELSRLKITIKGLWSSLPGWQKWGAVILAGIMVVWLASLEFPTPAKASPTAVTQQLSALGLSAENDRNYLEAIGYYEQWKALEPANPDARLSLAHAYLEYNENWIAFQQYKKAIWLYSPGTEKSRQADAGLQIAMEDSVCDMVRKQEFESAKLIQTEFKQQFPDLPFLFQFDCGKNVN